MSAPKQNNIVIESEVARLVTDMCNRSEKSQLQIAKESGFAKSNIITMLKTGRTKFPIRRVKDFSRAVDGDAEKLLDTILSEYMPEVRQVIYDIKHRSLSPKEHRIMAALRKAKENHNKDKDESADWTTNAKRLRKWAKDSAESLID